MSDKFREVIASKGAEAVIPPKRSEKGTPARTIKMSTQDRNLALSSVSCDIELRKRDPAHRHAMTTKPPYAFAAMLALAAAMIWLR